jgi:hypothetical protein
MAVPDSVSDRIAKILDWLEADPDDDPVADLSALRENFGRLSAPPIPESAFRRGIEQFDLRVFDVCDRFKPRLLNAALPLSRELHGASVDLVGALLDIAGGYLSLIGKLRERWTLGARSDPGVFAAHASRLVHEAYLLASMSGATPPAGLWLRAYKVILADGRLEGGADVAPDTPAAETAFHLKRLCALAVLQPESLTPREVVWAHDFLEGVAAAAGLSRDPAQPDSSAFWMDPAQDSPPVATVRREAPGREGILHFSSLGLARRTGEYIDWLKTRISEAEVVGLERDTDLLEPDLSGLPVGLTPVESLALLRRMRDRWAMPPSREQPRRHHQCTVQVCVGLKSIWEMSRRGPAAVSLAEWIVYNESPGGFAVMCVSGEIGALSAGMALALRRDIGQPWSICIVRWIRSENPDQVELGLQLVSQSFTPVSIGFRGSDVRLTAPALILPPAPALRRNQAMLAPAGTYRSRRFILVHDGGRVYVAQGRVLSLDIQTASVELFQFEIDPYPI